MSFDSYDLCVSYFVYWLCSQVTCTSSIWCKQWFHKQYWCIQKKMPKIPTHNTSLLLPKVVSALIYWCIRCCGLSRDSRVCSLHLNKIKNTVPLKQHDSSLHSPPPATNTLSPLLSFETTLFKTDFGCNVAFSTKEKFYCIEVCLNSFCPN